MHCDDFERLLNEQFDARDGASADVERALEAHASACDACRAVAARYHTLRQVLRAAGPAPVPSTDCVERILNAYALEHPRVFRLARVRPVLVPLAVAASLFLMVFVGWRSWPSRHQPAAPAAPRVAESIDPKSLTQALTLAGSATWELARETSGPAARIGRQVLDSAAIPETPPLPLSVPSAASADVLQSVGDRVNAGVRPFSGTARRAFGFLLSRPASGLTPSPRT